MKEPVMPDRFIDRCSPTTTIGEMDLPAILHELANQLTVANDFYYPLLAAAGQLRRINK